MKTLEISNTLAEVSKAVDFIREELRRKRIQQKERVRTVLLAEEVLAKMAEVSEEKISVSVSAFLGSAEIKISARGTAFSTDDIQKGLLIEETNLESEETNALIRQLLKKLFGDTFSIRNEYGINKISIRVKKSPLRSLLITLFALVAGVLTGLLIQKFLPEPTSKSISANLFTPIYTVFMNALKMIVAPLVFCSIASALADFSDLKALGRIAMKIVAMYLFTSMIAIGVGYITYQLLPIGHTSLVASVTDTANSTIAKGGGVTLSIKDTLVNIIPNNVITPFQKADMLQLIFMAVTLGLATASLSQKFPNIRNMLVMLNAVFSKITTVIVGFIPLIVFCAMAKMMLSIKLGHLLNVFVWVPVIYVGDILMICAYLLLLLIFARLNPFKFLGKYYPAMLSAYTLAASNPALPFSIKHCSEMGVSKRVYSFSLPLGATINMDGSCISLIITALFMAKIFSIPVTSHMLLTLFIAIMVLSVGSPGVPGGNLVCMTILLPQIGVPAEAVSLVMGLYPLVGMMQTSANVTGDAVVTTIVARQENLLDIEKYNA